MVPSHPFNEMKPNSGNTRVEPWWFTLGKPRIANLRFSKSRAIAINKARMIARFAQSGVSHFAHKDSGATQSGEVPARVGHAGFDDGSAAGLSSSSRWGGHCRTSLGSWKWPAR